MIDNLTFEQLLWCVGIIDGEGSFQSLNKGRSAAIVVGMHPKNVEILERLNKLLGGTIYGPYKVTHGEQMVWRIQDKLSVYKLSAVMYPLLSKHRKSQIEERVFTLINI